MKSYCLILILILMSIGTGLPQEGTATNIVDTNISLTNSTQINECAPTNNISTGNSQIVSLNKEKLNEMNVSAQNIDIIGLGVEVFELSNDAMARFGVGKKEKAKQEIYKISITNRGDVRIKDLIVTAELDKGMKFESCRYFEENRGRLDVIRDPCYFEEETKTNLTWEIGSLEIEEIKSIILEVYAKPSVDSTNVTVNATGKGGADFLVIASKDKAEVIDCEYEDITTKRSCYEVSDTCQVVDCPDWIVPQ